MRLINILRNKGYLAIGILAMISVAIVLPAIQTKIFLNSFEVWFVSLTTIPLNAALYILFSILFGLVVSLQVYSMRNPRVCKISNTKKGLRTGAFGAFFGFFIGVCPVCVGLLGLILPLGVILTLTAFGWVFMLIAIGIMIFSIYHLGGFKKE